MHHSLGTFRFLKPGTMTPPWSRATALAAFAMSSNLEKSHARTTSSANKHSTQHTSEIAQSRCTSAHRHNGVLANSNGGIHHCTGDVGHLQHSACQIKHMSDRPSAQDVWCGTIHPDVQRKAKVGLDEAAVCEQPEADTSRLHRLLQQCPCRSQR